MRLRATTAIKDNQGRSYLPNGAVHEAARDDGRVGRGDEGPPCVKRQGVKRRSRLRGSPRCEEAFRGVKMHSEV